MIFESNERKIMKKAKYIFYGFVVLVVILLIAAIFIPKEYSFQIEKKLDTSKSVVYNLLANLENRSQWDPVAYQSNVVLDADNTDKIFGWSVGDTDKGEVRVKSAVKGSTIILEVYKGRSDKPKIVQYTLDDEDVKGATSVIIDCEGRASWPMNLLNIITKRKQAKKLVAEVDQLEVIAKERQVDRIYNGYKIVEDIVKERNFIIRRDEIAAEAIPQFYVQNLGVLFKSVQDAGLQMDGMPCGLFYTKKMGSKTMDMAAAIPVIEEVNILGAESQNIKTRMAIVVDYYGNYNNTIKAHNAINAYMDDYSYAADTPIIEEYVTDPEVEKDPNKWLTKITYYINEK